MMRHLFKLALPACLAFFPVATNAADRAELAAAVDRAFAPLMKEYDVPGLTVAIIIDGEPHFFNYGVSYLENGDPVTEHTMRLLSV